MTATRVTRACETCQWVRPKFADGPELVCREGPAVIEVGADHWCSRYRLRESLAGGKDVRPKGEASG